MIHEPECPIGNSDDPLTFYAARQSVAIVCVCANIRAAYQRGREDAVQSVGMELLGRYGDPVNSALHEAVSAAARGDANCAHSRTQYTREVCWCGDAVDVCEDCGVDVHECADGADAGNRNASVPEDATPHATLTTLDDRK